jgi:hypothetical protein
MHTARCEWVNEKKDHTALWIAIAGIVISAYLAIAF